MALKFVSKGEGEVSTEHKPTGVKKSTKVHTNAVPSDGTLVGFRMGYTKNLGNYESLRVEVSLTLPTVRDPKKIDAAYKACKTWTDERLTAAIEEVDKEVGV